MSDTALQEIETIHGVSKIIRDQQVFFAIDNGC